MDDLVTLAERCEAEAIKQATMAVESVCWESYTAKAVGMFKLADALRARATLSDNRGVTK